MGAAATNSEEGKLSRLARWTLKWRSFVLAYIAVMIVDWFAIELRAGPVWCNGKIADRMPLLIAIFHPERMQYVATTDIKMNHQLLRSDFTFPTISEVFYNYLPRVDEIKGKYLKKDITAGNPILLTDLSPAPLIDPQPNTYTVNIRLSKQAIPKAFLEPKSTVSIAPKDSTDKLEGTVLSSTWDEAPSPSPAKSSDITKPSAATSSPGQTVPALKTEPSPNN
jgi:hypothetical protein